MCGFQTGDVSTGHLRGTLYRKEDGKQRSREGVREYGGMSEKVTRASKLSDE